MAGAVSRPTARSVSPSDYGQSATDLETLRCLVAAQCPHVGFGGHTPSGARLGAYSFPLAQGRSAGSGAVHPVRTTRRQDRPLAISSHRQRALAARQDGRPGGRLDLRTRGGGALLEDTKR